MNNSVILFRLLGMAVLGLAAPALLCHYAGPAVGVLGSAGAVALWYWHYRFPGRRERSGPYFWFVIGGYGWIAMILLICLGRLLGTRSS